MFFSVIVPVYNTEKYLHQCLDSLVDQICTDKEVIVVDDGSTDSSGVICDEYARKYDFVTVIHQENQGVSAARNAGLAVAKGEWISFVDSDDWVDTDMLELLQGYILATNADLYRFKFKRINQDGISKEENPKVNKHAVFLFKDEQALFNCCIFPNMFVSSVWRGVYRNSIIKKYKLRFVDTHVVYTEDGLFNYQYFLHIQKLVSIRDVLYYYRQRKDSFVHITSPKQKLFCSATWGECAYQATVESNMVYFQKKFHMHYFHFLNYRILGLTDSMDDAQIRQILDEMWENKLHRRCIEKIRQDSFFFKKHTGNKTWYDENFGLEESIKSKIKNWRNENSSIV